MPSVREICLFVAWFATWVVSDYLVDVFWRNVVNPRENVYLDMLKDVVTFCWSQFF